MRLSRRALAAGVWWALACVAWGQGPPPSPVRTAEVVRREVIERRMVTGELRAPHRALVASWEPGVVEDCPIEVGEIVKRGDLLARLDGERLEIERRTLLAEREQALAELEQERAERDRWREESVSMEDASARGASNAKERREAAASLRAGEARALAAEQFISVIDSRIELLTRRLKDMHIVAPFDGVVLRRVTESGQWLGAGDSVAEVMRTDTLEAWLDVPQGYLAPFVAARRVGDEGMVLRVDATGKLVEFNDARILPMIDERARTFRVVASTPNPEGILAPGLSLSAWVPTGATGERLLVPVDAVMRGETGTYVYALRPGQGEGQTRVMPVPVRIVFELPGEAVVEGGLAPGDRVVTEGNERLYPTAPVRAVDAAGAGGS